MTMHRLAPSVAATVAAAAKKTATMKKAAAVAALTIAVTGVASGAAWAGQYPVVPCSDVKLPGEQPVAGGAVHHGSPTITVSSLRKAVVHGDSVSYEVRLTETNHTGAAYRHLTAAPVLFTQFGVMDTSNTRVSWLHDGNSVALPTKMGCDPSVWVTSAALDTPLADGQSVSFDLVISSSVSAAEKMKELTVTATGEADGGEVLNSNQITIAKLTPAPAQPTTPPAEQPITPATPTAQPAKPAQQDAVPAALTTKTSPTPAAPAPAPAAASATPVAAQTASLASTGGGSHSTALIAGAAALLAAGAAVLFGVKRRARHGN
ncbi:hypothetical protein CFP65_3541 [Kitasatospora sp. MMS16-BH015]|uniref:LPXTG cell wall anchor domain-containing protein n=1 Tax=Kitasatospora sp. MMS16-BH015 TaxID=2018025 RepID=UPI000CA18ECD|nr:LPXTG cell wall anchor domain-containing protein [Kitasatospora sp. MMS16-BH015]AUG78331.1 hypothetical protein CFP65_3541 [Kitasatospora sp. MMS16-BH015]